MPEPFDLAPPPVWIGACALLTVFYARSWPRRQAAGMSRGVRYFILRWFHALVWALLGLSLWLHAGESDSAHLGAKAIAVLALLVYLTFAGVLLVRSRF